MTDQEKKMNRDTLDAYKVYDNSNYTLIPGISTTKQIKMKDSMTRSQQKSQNSYNSNLLGAGAKNLNKDE